MGCAKNRLLPTFSVSLLMTLNQRRRADHISVQNDGGLSRLTRYRPVSVYG